MDVDEPPAGRRLGHPLGGLPHRRRSLQPGTVDIRQPADVVEGLRPVQPFVADLREHRVIELVLRVHDGDAVTQDRPIAIKVRDIG